MLSPEFTPCIVNEKKWRINDMCIVCTAAIVKKHISV